MFIPRIRLNRLGSDPEFLFVADADFDFLIKPANTILGKNKAKTSTSFIGTDNRPVLGEIRPSPFRNIKNHLFEIAYALDEIYKHLDEKHPKTYVLAYPSLHGENLGGHLHASFFAEDPVQLRLRKLGYALGGKGELIEVNPTQGLFPSEVERYHRAVEDRSVLLPYDWAQIVNWLLLPFENWVQPWTARERRNEHYGGSRHPDIVRLGTSVAPTREGPVPSWWPNSVYLHWEYRLPSTWLHHPCLAYTYFALMKFTMLNFQRIAEAYLHYTVDKAKKKIATGTPGGIMFAGEGVYAGGDLHNYKQIQPAENTVYAELLQTRLAQLMQGHPILSNDLAQLQRAIEQCASQRQRWFASPGPIEIQEWRRLLA